MEDREKFFFDQLHRMSTETNKYPTQENYQTLRVVLVSADMHFSADNKRRFWRTLISKRYPAAKRLTHSHPVELERHKMQIIDLLFDATDSAQCAAVSLHIQLTCFDMLDARDPKLRPVLRLVYSATSPV
jgi:hypothetical protein